MRVCRECSKSKAIKQFQIDNRRKDGHTRLCKLCASNYANSWHKANRERHNKKMKEWRDKDKVKNPHTYLWRIAKRRAKENGRPFSIKPSHLKVPKRCPALEKVMKFIPGKYSPYCPSTDCIIPSKGYVPGNVAVISHRANTIKQNATVKELRQIADWLERVTKS